MKLQKYISVLLDLFLMLCLLIFFASAGFQDNLVNGWYQQYLPSGISKPIADMVFLDSLTGFIVTGADTVGNTNYILETTDGGDNWFINNSVTAKFFRIQFINDSIGFAGASNKIYKTTNKGNSWNIIYFPTYPIDMFVLNQDTIFCADDQPIIGGLYRTTNGGTSWSKLVNFGSCNPEKIYFFNKYNSYMAKCNELWKSTNCGISWFYLASGNWLDIHFLDSLTGYKADGGIRKTTDGGYNWIQQQMPNITFHGVGNISLINKDTIWGVGGAILINSTYYGVVYKTTNGGSNWGYQIPLNTNSITQYFNITSINKKNLWAYFLFNTGVHSKIGGNDTTIFTGLTLIGNNVPEKFLLGQNYPNPFNPVAKIPYELKGPGYIVLKVYDITGRMVKELVNGKWGTGKYIADFDGTGLSSGTYFYRIEITGETTNERFSDSKKMLMIK